MFEHPFARGLVCVGLAAVLLGGCGDDGGDDVDSGTDAGVADAGDAGPTDAGGDAADDGGLDPRVAACRAAIEAKETEVGDAVDGWPIEDAPEMVAEGGSQDLEADYAGKYRGDLPNHPGCMERESYGANTEFLISDNEAEVPDGAPNELADYPCAAKAYDQPSEDTAKPIVILVHGNSSGVLSFEEYFNASLAGSEISNVAGFTFTVDTEVREMLASKLLAEGYRVYSFDARVDLVSTLEDFNPDSSTGNAFHNIDHGWAVPMLQDLVKTVMTDNPDRMVSIIGHSLGATVTRDALRRLYVEWKNGDEGAVNPFAQLQDVVLLSGANHGVANGNTICDSFPNQMRGTVTCEMGDRQDFVPTYFTRRINGPSDLFSAPCADGDYAFGERDQCGGNVVEYTTVTMEDLPGGELQDEFVSEQSSQLDLDPCVENELIGLDAFDSSGYFFTGAPGFFANHFGSPRSNAGMQLILDKLSD